MEDFINENKDNIVNSVMDLVKFKSVSEKTDFKESPFGEECKKALDYILDLGKRLGFRTKNIDGYCGYIEFGEGEEIVGIIGHLDVVPAKKDDGWVKEPFEPEIRDGKIYGRGTIDDKGPVIAALYAMKAVQSNLKVNRRVRLILGLNEEKDWECIDYYKKHEEKISIGFSPDANFPCIYAEKGIVTVKIEGKFNIDGVEILKFDCGDNAINVVPKYCSVELKLLNEASKNYFQNQADVEVEYLEENIIKITATGVSAHAAHPELGDNAITKLLRNFKENSYINFLEEEGIFDLQSPKFLGGSLTEDESGKLTSNIGKINYKDGKLEIYTNLRVPVNTSFDTIEDYMKVLKEKYKFLDFELFSKNDKLYVSKNSYLVNTLTSIFNNETGLNTVPIAIGGGTYARAFENCVSFGMTMPGDKDMCHQVDEFVKIDDLILSVKIYAKAIYELANHI